MGSKNGAQADLSSWMLRNHINVKLQMGIQNARELCIVP